MLLDQDLEEYWHVDDYKKNNCKLSCLFKREPKKISSYQQILANYLNCFFLTT